MRNWPLSDLRIVTPRVELRWPMPEDLDALADCAAEGVHPPEFMPFFSQWTDGDRDTVTRRVLQRHWNSLGSWQPDDWTLYLAVISDGEVVGSQSIGARNFRVTREVLLTSWLGLRHQGRGLGTHARAATLELAFAGLGAEVASVVVRQGNEASQSVCRKFGFAHDGTQINAVRGERVLSDRFRLSRSGWDEHPRTPITISGLAQALPLFGLSPAVPAAVAAPAAAAVTAELLSGVRYAAESDLGAD